MKKNKVYISIFLIISIVFLGFQFLNNIKSKEILNTTTKFFEAVVDNDVDKAKTLALGQVLFNISTNKKADKEEHKTLNIKPYLEQKTQQWSIVNIKIETSNINGISDVHFYKVKLIKVIKDWKIVSLSEIEPFIEKGFSYEKVSEKELVDQFNRYLISLKDKEYDEAGKYLISLAKNSHESTKDILSKTNLITEIDINKVELRIISKSKNQVTAKVRHTLNGKDIENIVSFYKTSQGYKIYGILQI